MRAFIRDVGAAKREAKEAAVRELTVTVVVALIAFFVGPAAVAVISIKDADWTVFFSAFWGADIFICSVSLLSITIYSFAKEYVVKDKEIFRFPHAATILLSGFTIFGLALTIYTARLFNEAAPILYEWRPIVAAIAGVTVFAITCYIAYGVMVLRNGMDPNAAQEMRREENAFAEGFAAVRAPQAEGLDVNRIAPVEPHRGAQE